MPSNRNAAEVIISVSFDGPTSNSSCHLSQTFLAAWSAAVCGYQMASLDLARCQASNPVLCLPSVETLLVEAQLAEVLLG